MKKLMMLLGAVTFAFTLVTAEGKCDKDNKGTKTETKCDNGESGGDKKMPVGGKCGQGKCGG